MREAFSQWLKSCPPGPWVAIHDYDADGIAAGVLWTRLAQFVKRESQRWSVGTVSGQIGSRDLEHFLPALAAAAPAAIISLDLGTAACSLMPPTPTLFLDHHFSSAPPREQSDECTVFNGRDLQPSPCTSLLVYHLLQSLGDFSDLGWIATLGAYSDLGDKAPYEVVAATNLQYSKKALRDLTGLINSGRRGPVFQPDVAAAALLNHDDPLSLLHSKDPAVESLRAGQAAAHTAFQKAKQIAPRFSKEAALLIVKSPCRIHGLLAQVWRNRLPDHFVIVGNVGLAGDSVEFSVRCRKEKNALLWLAPYLETLLSHPVQGHPQASGGRLSREGWNRLVLSLGFSAAR